ncbi:cell division protein ZipA [Alteromonas pelagimontana]|uniref:Cell division protein ZipA n=1 Tax=Alteromonas pelagimontana TaxID=1858656 RepID=A0A6M4MHU8_9ALTE|nr:cell division protein ZipA [Alteromonas pelagimontana]QJR82498.1 cell division protein ZipA [Alteromonas pelagimontana]
MEDELRLSLLVAGTLFIVAVLAHGIWKIRKNGKSETKRRVEPRRWDEEADNDTLDNDDVAWSADDMGTKSAAARSPREDENEYDELGLGPVRVVSSNPATKSKPGDSASAPETPNAESAKSAQGVKADTRLYGSVISNPKPHLQSNRSPSTDRDNELNMPEPPGFLLKKNESTHSSSQDTEHPMSDAEKADKVKTDDFKLDVQSLPEDDRHSAGHPAGHPSEEDNDSEEGGSLGEQARRFVNRKRSKGSPKHRQEPSFGDDQMRIDFEETTASAATTEENATNSDTSQKPSSAAEQEVLVLNVRAPESELISGASLLPLLLTLGFKFGDQDIFHRHVNSNGKGPVLFSLANMFKPGVFDIDNLETFTTQGVTLFMILPIEGDAHQVFNMMHNAARKIAEEFSAQVLDGRRSVLTKQGLQQYIEKIRDFERQRMINRY